MDRIKETKENGKKMLLDKRYEEAIAYYKAALGILENKDAEVVASEGIVLQEEKAIMFTNIGICYFSLKKYDRAMENYRLAQQASKTYEKSFYRAAVCLEKMGEFKEALLSINKVSEQGKDSDFIKIKARLISEVSKDQEMQMIVPKLTKNMAEKNREKGTVRDKATGASQEVCRYKNEKEIEYDLSMINKAVEKGAVLTDMVYALDAFYLILRGSTLLEWSNMLGRELFMKILAIGNLIVENISARHIEKVYDDTQNEFIGPNIAKFYIYLWKGLIEYEDMKEIGEILRNYPLFFTNIDAINSISIALRLAGDKESVHAELFLNQVHHKVKQLNESKCEGLFNKEKKALEVKHSAFTEFVERVSRVNSKTSKSFLILFFKTAKDVCGFSIYRLLFHNMAHLFRDKFSFQSILLLNCLLLSDYPVTLEDFLKIPLFFDSVVLLVQHLNYMVREGDVRDKKNLFKLENAFQLLYLCVSNKEFIRNFSRKVPPDDQGRLRQGAQVLLGGQLRGNGPVPPTDHREGAALHCSGHPRHLPGRPSSPSPPPPSSTISSP